MSSEEKDNEYEKCVVTFMDILGFRYLINTRKPSSLAKDLSLFRDLSPSEKHPLNDKVPCRYLGEIHSEIISDAIVRVRTTSALYSEGPFNSELLDLIHIQVDCLKRDILIRGAMTYGEMYLGKNLEGPVFGPALVEAYQAEEQEAVYPRIVISSKMLKVHRDDKSLWKTGHTWGFEEKFRDKLIVQDFDGRWFVDYLRGSRAEMDGDANWLDFLLLHKRNIQKRLQEKNTDNIQAKLHWMKNYHNTVVGEIPESNFKKLLIK